MISGRRFTKEESGVACPGLTKDYEGSSFALRFGFGGSETALGLAESPRAVLRAGGAKACSPEGAEVWKAGSLTETVGPRSSIAEENASVTGLSVGQLSAEASDQPPTSTIHTKVAWIFSSIDRKEQILFV